MASGFLEVEVVAELLDIWIEDISGTFLLLVVEVKEDLSHQGI